MKKPDVTVIPASVEPVSFHSLHPGRKKRTAGYARVSSNSDEQENSYEAQVDYYTKLIQENPEWEFVKIYADDGISATNTKHRDGFNEMLVDALDGKIDLIITNAVITKGQFLSTPKNPQLWQLRQVEGYITGLNPSVFCCISTNVNILAMFTTGNRAECDNSDVLLRVKSGKLSL